MLIDTHCHLDYLQKNCNLDDIIVRSRSAGVGKIITISTFVKEFEIIKAITEQYDDIFCTIGTHPCNVDNDEFDIENVLNLCKSNDKIIGIGETGLDLYRNENPPLNLQIDFLEKHIFVAKQMNLPLIFHCRASENESIEILKSKEYIGLKCIMHCFTGSYEFAKKCLDLGFYISFSGIVTFKNAQELREIAQKIPLDRLLIETDAPFLAPMPMRGKENEPSFLPYTAKFLAEMFNIEYNVFLLQLFNNYKALFNR